MSNVRAKYDECFLRTVQGMIQPIFRNPIEGKFPKDEKSIREFDEEYQPVNIVQKDIKTIEIDVQTNK